MVIKSNWQYRWSIAFGCLSFEKSILGSQTLTIIQVRFRIWVALIKIVSLFKSRTKSFITQLWYCKPQHYSRRTCTLMQPNDLYFHSPNAFMLVRLYCWCWTLVGYIIESMFCPQFLAMNECNHILSKLCTKIQWQRSSRETDPLQRLHLKLFISGVTRYYTGSPALIVRIMFPARFAKYVPSDYEIND